MHSMHQDHRNEHFALTGVNTCGRHQPCYGNTHTWPFIAVSVLRVPLRGGTTSFESSASFQKEGIVPNPVAFQT
jgi:hypothetical protein